VNKQTGGASGRESVLMEKPLMIVFHVSEEANIEVFEPRKSDATDRPLVWAVDDEHLRNYLVPRDCPRVTYSAGRRTSVADRDRFLGSSVAVLAIETAWFERMRACRLYCYQLPGDTFELADECAGYLVSGAPVKPIGVRVIDDAVSAVLERNVELRVQPSLWALRNAVVESTLEFSIIRWRNAAPQQVTAVDGTARSYR
jgi:hypothetical protein